MMIVRRRFRRGNHVSSCHPGPGLRRGRLRPDPSQLRFAAPALFVLLAAIASPTAANPNGVPTMNDSAPNLVTTTDANPETTGLHDFDFFMGRWNVHGRRLRERLKGSHEWIDIEATSVA